VGAMKEAGRCLREEGREIEGWECDGWNPQSRLAWSIVATKATMRSIADRAELAGNQTRASLDTKSWTALGFVRLGNYMNDQVDGLFSGIKRGVRLFTWFPWALGKASASERRLIPQSEEHRRELMAKLLDGCAGVLGTWNCGDKVS